MTMDEINAMTPGEFVARIGRLFEDRHVGSAAQGDFSPPSVMAGQALTPVLAPFQ